MPPIPAGTDPSRVEDEPPSKKPRVSTPPPLYGSREYWDARYRQHHIRNVADNGQADAEAMPYHAWYFTYSDLRPLILPLLLGGKNTGRIDGDLFDGESDQFKMTEHGTPNKETQITSINNEAAKVGISDNKIDHKQNRKTDTSDSDSKDDDDENDEERDDGLVESCEFVEVDESDDESDGDESQEREGLAKDGPVSVLEIGCGDVPLGADLAIELISLEKEGATKVDAVIKKIVCCDYSPTVIAMLNTQKQEAKGLESDDLATLDTILDYQVADARKMPQYKDKSIELVLEKGTLDAMLSDKEAGVTNCIAIVTEIARVLTIGGYIVLVSHLNAHTKNGIEWLHEVILPGLRSGGRNATWEIEVHGSDGTDDVDTGKVAAPISPGPCVYIIHKMVAQAEDESAGTKETPNIPLSFFTY